MQLQYKAYLILNSFISLLNFVLQTNNVLLQIVDDAVELGDLGLVLANLFLVVVDLFLQARELFAHDARLIAQLLVCLLHTETTLLGLRCSVINLFIRRRLGLTSLVTSKKLLYRPKQRNERWKKLAIKLWTFSISNSLHRMWRTCDNMLQNVLYANKLKVHSKSTWQVVRHTSISNRKPTASSRQI